MITYHKLSQVLGCLFSFACGSARGYSFTFVRGFSFACGTESVSPTALHVSTPSPVALCAGSSSPSCLLGGIVRALASPCPKLGAASWVCVRLSRLLVVLRLASHVSWGFFFSESVKDSVSNEVCATLLADFCGDCQLCSCLFPWWLVFLDSVSCDGGSCRVSRAVGCSVRFTSLVARVVFSLVCVS